MKKVPTIILSVSYKGVKFIDAANKVGAQPLLGPSCRHSPEVGNIESWRGPFCHSPPSPTFLLPAHDYGCKYPQRKAWFIWDLNLGLSYMFYAYISHCPL